LSWLYPTTKHPTHWHLRIPPRAAEEAHAPVPASPKSLWESSNNPPNASDCRVTLQPVISVLTQITTSSEKQTNQPKHTQMDISVLQPAEMNM